MDLPTFSNDKNLSNQGYESKVVTMDFLGLNYQKQPNEGELIDMKNLSSDEPHCLSIRKPRKKITKIGENEVKMTDPTALATKDGKLAWVDGTDFYYNGVKKGTVTAGEKQIVTMINKIIIFPDKVYYDVKAGEIKKLENIQTLTSVTFTETTITCSSGDVSGFIAGDSVKISGCTSVTANNKESYLVIKSVSGKTLTFDTGTFTAGSESSITVKRDVPDFTCVCTSNNRLWGVAENTIYGSKLGDPTNFNTFMGLNNDSYAVQVETDGEFTGCANANTHICFFKEDCVHKLYGSKPSQYQINTSQCPGVEKGSMKSLVAINDVLYYKSRSGIMAYLGSQPDNISLNFGNVKFCNAKAGTDGSKYYVSMFNKTTQKQEFLVYDIVKQLWHKEDDTIVNDFCFTGGILYYIDDVTNELIAVNDDNCSERIEWLAELGNINEHSENTKIYSKVSGIAEVDVSTEVYIDLKKDAGEWENVFANRAVEKGVFNISFEPMRCNTFSVRIYGKGNIIVHSLVREFLIGSDVNGNN